MENIYSSETPMFVDVANSDVYETVEIGTESNAEESEEVINQDKVSNKIKCLQCKHYTAPNEDQLARHILKVHRGKHPYQCIMCDYKTSNKGNFDDHMNIHEGVKPHQCSHCPYKSTSKSNLKKHEAKHNPDNPLKCSQCGYLARHKKAFDHHIKKEHDTSPMLSCVKCNTTFEDLKGLKSHLSDLIACSECDFVTCSNTLFMKHTHTKEKIIKQSNTWKCALCPWQGVRIQKILLHLIHHPDQEVHAIDLSVLRKHGIMK